MSSGNDNTSLLTTIILLLVIIVFCLLCDAYDSGKQERLLIEIRDRLPAVEAKP